MNRTVDEMTRRARVVNVARKACAAPRRSAWSGPLHIQPMLKSPLALLLLMAPLSITKAQRSPPMRPLIEELRIDGKSHEWTRIGIVRVSPSGPILVGENRGTSIRVFSPSGQLVRSLGRRGQGPGEFQEVTTLGVLGDTIWAGDHTAARLTFFDLPGNVLGTTRMDSGPVLVRDAGARVVQSPRLLWTAPRVIYPDGTALVTPLTTSGDADTLGNVSVYPFWRTTRRGRVLDTVLTVIRESPAVRVASADGSRHTFLANPFPQRQHAAASVDGRRLAVVDASYMGRDAWSYGVRAMDERGRQLYARRFPFSRAPVPTHVVDSIVGVMTTRFQAYTGIRQAIPVPASYPPVTRVLIATDGSVWLRGRDDPAGATWTILDPKGDPVAMVREPPRTRFIEVDGGVWATERDADDVESIIRYRIGPR